MYQLCVRVDLASPTAGQPLICALIGGAQPINGCRPPSRNAILKERVGAKGTITKVHRRPPKPTYRPSPIRSGRRCKRREAPRRLRRRPRPRHVVRDLCAAVHDSGASPTSAWRTTKKPAPPRTPRMVCTSTSLSLISNCSSRTITVILKLVKFHPLIYA